ncbi:hypothetical protein BGZ73_008559 [Actinomortierella ambigua]|nr:hypothetical protein BGZ73_008559 [Actinomortierella ambigua]
MADSLAITLLLSVRAESQDHHDWSSSEAPDAQVSASLRSAAPQASKVAFASLHPDPAVHMGASRTLATEAICTSTKSQEGHCPSSPKFDGSHHHAHNEKEANPPVRSHPENQKRSSPVGIRYTSPEEAPIAVGNEDIFQVGHVDEDHQDAAHITTTPEDILEEHRSSSASSSSSSFVPLNQVKFSDNNDEDKDEDDDIRKIIFGPERHLHEPTIEVLRKRYDAVKAAAQQRHQQDHQQQQPEHQHEHQKQDPLQVPIEKPLVTVAADKDDGESDEDDDTKNAVDESRFKFKPTIDMLKRAVQDSVDGWDEEWIDIEDDTQGTSPFEQILEDEDQDDDNDNEKRANEGDEAEEEGEAMEMDEGEEDTEEGEGFPATSPKIRHAFSVEQDLDDEAAEMADEGLLSKVLSYIPGHHAHEDARHHPIEDFVVGGRHRADSQSVLQEMDAARHDKSNVKKHGHKPPSHRQPRRSRRRGCRQSPNTEPQRKSKHHSKGH